MKKIALVGATGRTGLMTANVLMELIVSDPETRLVVAGRDKLALERLSTDLGRRFKKPIDITGIDLADRSALRVMCEGAEVVINCAGPYAAVAPPIVATAVHGKAHYLDACNDPAFYEHCARVDGPAKEAGIAVVNGMSVAPGIADIAAAEATAGWKTPKAIHVMCMVQNLDEGVAARQSYLEMIGQPARTFVDKRVQNTPIGSKKHVFKWPGGQSNGVLAGGGEPFTIPRHVSGVSEVFTYQQVQGVQKLLAPFASSLVPILCKLPNVVKWAKEGSRSLSDSSAFATVVELDADGPRRFGVVQGNGFYATTAKMLAHTAVRLLREGPLKKGLLSPSQVVDPKWLLGRLGLEVQVVDA